MRQEGSLREGGPNKPSVGLISACMYGCAVECRQATDGFKGSNREGLVFSLETTKLILAQVIAAIQGVHCTNTLHADIKPENFLVSQ